MRLTPSTARRALSLVGCLLSVAALVRAEYGIRPAPTCDPVTEYLDIAALECRRCGSNKEADADTTDRAGNALGCRCEAGFAASRATCDAGAMEDGSCTLHACADADFCPSVGSGLAARLDDSGCIRCGANATLSDATSDCACDHNEDSSMVLLETDAAGRTLDAKTCVPCPANERVVLTRLTTAGVTFEADPYRCRACPDPMMRWDGDACVCAPRFAAVGSDRIGAIECLPDAQTGALESSENAATSVAYTSLRTDPAGGATGSESATSLWAKHLYVKSAARCRYFTEAEEDYRACQALANLCVLNHYDDGSPACARFEEIAGARDGASHGRGEWREKMPWLRYREDAEDVQDDRGIAMAIAFTGDGVSRFDTLSFKIARYSLNGTWLGLDDVGTRLQDCTLPPPKTASGGGTSSSSAWMKVGHSLRETYRCSLEGLLAREQEFWDMYLVDAATDTLFPVPVRNVNLRDGSVRPNVNERYGDGADDVFTRRFFLFDISSGVDEGAAAGADGRLTPKIIRYAKSMKLVIRTQPGAPARLHPPVLQISYEDVKVSALRGDDRGLAQPTLHFHVEYSASAASFYQALVGLMSAGAIAALGVFALRFINWRANSVRAGYDAGGVDFEYLARTVVLLVHSFNVVFFPICFAMCAYYFAFFKLQADVYLMLPTEAHGEDGTFAVSYVFSIFFHLMFFFQLIRVCHLLYVQCRVEIFLVDWEKPKGSGVGVSAWRQILVANQWNELQAMRRVSTTPTLLGLAFLLVGLGLDNLASPHPSLTGAALGRKNAILRFANVAFWWILLTAVQWLWRCAVQERYIEERRAQHFVDLCTVAKISVVIFDAPFHGYYLHCNAPYEHADVSMKELSDQLANEEMGLTTSRGLADAANDPALRDVQAFELYATAVLRRKIDRFGSQAGAAAAGARRSRQARGRHPFSPETMGLPERAESNRDLSELFKLFVQNSFHRPELRHEAREQTVLERLLRRPPEMSNDRSTLLPDATLFGGRRFLSVTLLGAEGDILLFAMLAHAVCDLWFENTGVSIFVTYVLDSAVRWARRAFSRSNVAGRTGTDQRFLV